MGKIISVGDSHSMIFEGIPNLLPVYVPGATNMGLKNPHSKTNALNVFERMLDQNLKEDDTIIFLMGEVDCGFVIWHRVEKYNETLESQMNESLSNYFNFIVKYKNLCKRIVICDVVPPTMGDIQNIKDDNDNLRLEIKATQKERTNLTLKYNSEIERFCVENNFTYLSFTKEMLGEDGLVMEKYKNKHTEDHHLDRGTFSDILNKKMKELNIL
jgi:hypothetical protein